MNSKNILLIHSFGHDGNQPIFDGVSYHRMVKPNQVLTRLFPEYNFRHSPSYDEGITEEYLKTNDLVIFCRMIPEGYAERLNKLGIKFGVDMDDFWILPEHHLLYTSYIENDTTNKLIQSLKEAHFVITTTEYLANKCKEYNKNVFIIENGIDEDIEAWQPFKTPSKRIRYGFTQGTTHLEDIRSIAPDVAKSLYDLEFYDNCQVVLTGYNRDANPYIGYEIMLTDGLKTLAKYEQLYVKRLKQGRTPKETNKAYRRIEQLNVFDFGHVYDEFDISVIPLIENEFNACKSELKLIEAGFKGVAAMVNHVQPYTIVATKDNSFDLNQQSFYDWQHYIKFNPEAIKDRAAQLTLDTKKYSLNLLTTKRKQLYDLYL